MKKLKLENNNIIEYIECTSNDYRIAYDLLKDGILDNTLDDIPRSSKELLNIINKYLKEKTNKDNIPVDKIIFTRKDIREYSSWSFVQIRNNMKTLKDYEYIQLLPVKNGQPHKYRILFDYSEECIKEYILSPKELEKILNT